jgi:hypothetical protein
MAALVNFEWPRLSNDGRIKSRIKGSPEAVYVVVMFAAVASFAGKGSMVSEWARQGKVAKNNKGSQKSRTQRREGFEWGVNGILRVRIHQEATASSRFSSAT